MKSLTKRQKEICDYIETYFVENRLAPSYREIMRHFGYSSLGTVNKHIQALKKKGLLTSEGRSPRSLAISQPTPPSPASVEVPFIGMLRAGFPIQTFPQSKMISLPSFLVPDPEQCYLLRIQGDALREDQISEGDLIVVKAQHEVAEGEMAVVLVNQHDILIKKYYPDGPYVRLEAINHNVRPIILRQDNLEIQGVLVALLRNYSLKER